MKPNKSDLPKEVAESLEANWAKMAVVALAKRAKAGDKKARSQLKRISQIIKDNRVAWTAKYGE